MTLNELTPSALDYILTNLDEQQLSNDWEQGFVMSVRKTWIKTRQLSTSQKLKLGEIWDRQK